MRDLTHNDFEDLKDRYFEDRLTSDEEQSIERHLETCKECQEAEVLAQKFADALRTITEAERMESQRTAAPTEVDDPSGQSGARADLGNVDRLARRWSIVGSPWGKAIAASALLVLGGAGGWALASAPEQAVLAVQTSTPFDRGTVRDLRLPRRFDFSATGIPDYARELWRTSFTDHSGDMGMIIAVEMPGSPGVDLCAFNRDGSLAWQASRSWTEWGRLLNLPNLELTGLKCVASGGRSPSLAETAVLSLRHERQSCLLMIAPRSGHLIGRLFYEGQFSQDAANFETIAVLPQMTDGPRRLLVAAKHIESDRSTPTLLVVDLDGTPRQHLGFPLLGTEDPLRVRVWHIRTTWSAQRPEVTIATSEELYFSFLVHDHLLDTDASAVLARIGDPAIPAYDRLHGSGTFKAMAGGASGSDERRGYLDSLAEGVKVLSIDLGPQEWEGGR